MTTQTTTTSSITINGKKISLPRSTTSLEEWVKENVDDIEQEEVGELYPVEKIDNSLIQVENKNTNIFYLNMYLSLLQQKQQSIQEIIATDTNLKQAICSLLECAEKEYTLNDLQEMIDNPQKENEDEDTEEPPKKLQFTIAGLRQRQREIDGKE